MAAPPVKQEPAPHAVSLKPVCCIMLVLSVHIQWHRTSGLHASAGSKGFVVIFRRQSPRTGKIPLMEQPEPRRGGGGRKTQKKRALLMLRYDGIRFLLLLASARCFATKVAVWKQRAKLGAAPEDIPAPASKKQNPSISSSQSRCQQLLLSPGLNMHFYPSFNSCGGGGCFPAEGSQQSTQPPKPSQKKKARREIWSQDQMHMIVRHGKCNNYQTLEIVSE